MKGSEWMGVMGEVNTMMWGGVGWCGVVAQSRSKVVVVSLTWW